VRSWYLTCRNEPSLEHRLLREIFGPKEVKGDGRKLYNGEGDSWFWPTPNTILVTKSQTMRLAEHVAYIAVRETFTGVWR
jgi:hypothetical protein